MSLSVNVLNSPNPNPIRYLYHISDIHIRNVSRHDEYRSVFNKLYENLKTEQSKWDKNIGGLVVITGDIVHSKSQISPQLNIMLRDFLTNLGSIMPVIMIAGNHDLNLSNLAVPDTLTSILHKSPVDNLHYLKDSGIYQWNNVQFSVMSVLNYPLIKASQFPDSNADSVYEKTFKVGLLHATLHGSKICTSTVPLTSDKYKAGDFEGYDYVLLGDIHLHQYMNAKRTIGYAGSLIQQSFGEQLKNHGYLRWDLAEEPSKAGKLMEIPNDWGFLSLQMKRNEIYPLDLAYAIRSGDLTIPKKVHVKIKMMDRSSDIEIAENFLRNMKVKGYWIQQQLIIPYSRVDSSISRFDNENNRDTDVDPNDPNERDDEYVDELLNQSNLPNLTNVEYQKQLIEEYLGSDHEDLIKVQDLHDQFYRENGSNINTSTGTSGTSEVMATDSGEIFHWDLLSMEFHNAFSFKGTSYIDFNKMDGIVGIVGPNFSGKSNILDILLFALFDHASRGERNDIITSGEKDMWIKLEFKIGLKKFTINRIGKVSVGKDGTEKAKIDVRFFSSDKDLTGESRLATNKVITSYIGSYDDFILTTLKLQQGSVGNLINLSNSQRKERLVDLLKLNVLDDYYKIGYNQFKDNKKAIDIYVKEMDAIPGDLTGKLENILEGLIKSKTELNVLKREMDIEADKLNKLNCNLQKVDNSLLELNPDIVEQCTIGKIEKPEIDLSKLREMDKLLSVLNDKISDQKSKLKPLNFGMKLNELEENIKLYRETIVDYEEKIKEREKEEREDKMVLDALRENVKDYKKQLTDWDESWRNKIKLESWIANTKRGADKLLNLEYDPKCDYCVNNPFVKEAISCRDELSEKEKQLVKVIEKISEMEGIKEDLREVEEEAEKLQKKLDNRVSAKMETEISRWNKELDDLRLDHKNLLANEEINKRIRMLDTEKDKIQDERDSLFTVWEHNQLVDKITDELIKKNENKKWEMQIKELNQDISKHRARRSELEEYIMKESAQEQILGEKIERQRELELKIKRLRDSNKALEVYCHCLAKDGISKFLIEKYMPEFERIVNLIMSDLVNFKIKMDIGDKKWNLYVVYNDRELNIDLCSGYEKFIVGLAIKCTLHHLSQLSKPYFMIIDEGFGALDSYHIGEIGRIFNYLRSKYRFVLLITHVESIKDDLDDQIEIKRTGQYSKVDNRQTRRLSIQLKSKLRFKKKN